MFVLCSKILAGDKQFGGVNSVVVKRSVDTIGATAVIKVPVSSVLKQKDATTYTETAKAIKIGDKVTIELGYNDALKTEFVGYVRGFNYKTPLEIECEDEFYQCRARSIKHSGKTTLKALLEKCGLQIGYAETLTIADFPVPDARTGIATVSSVLSRLKTKYLLSIFFDLEGKVYACRPSSIVGDTVKYRFRYNTINEDNLQYHRKEDVKIKIKAVCFKKDGTEIEVTAGDKNGSEKTLQFYDVESKTELEMLAAAELERHCYDGYSGKIETFLQPYAAPCMIAQITDPVYSERNGDYLIDAVETTFSTAGARRSVEIGLKI